MSRYVLKDLVNFKNGYAFKSKFFSDSDGIPLIRIRDIKNPTTKTYYFGEYDNDFIVKNGDFLIGMDGNFEIAKWKGKDSLLNQRVCTFKIKDNNLNKKYLYYFLKIKLKQIEDVTGYTTVKHLSINTLKNIEIEIPSLQEQEKIVERLDNFFKTNDKSIKLKKSIGNNIISYYKLNINDLFTQLEEEITISDFVNDSKKDIVDGPFGSNLKREHFVSSGLEVLKLQDIKENNIHKKSKDYVTKDKFLELKRHSFKPNDLILTKLGNPLGICAIVKDHEGLIVADLLRVRCKNLLDAKFLMYQINSLGFQKIINSFQRGSTRPRIRISDFRNIKIKTCSTKEKREIVELIEKFDSLKTQYLSSNKLLIDNYLDLNTSVLNKEFSYE